MDKESLVYLNEMCVHRKNGQRCLWFASRASEIVFLLLVSPVSQQFKLVCYIVARMLN